jgi:hypothetical protein
MSYKPNNKFLIVVQIIRQVFLANRKTACLIKLDEKPQGVTAIAKALEIVFVFTGNQHVHIQTEYIFFFRKHPNFTHELDGVFYQLPGLVQFRTTTWHYP